MMRNGSAAAASEPAVTAASGQESSRLSTYQACLGEPRLGYARLGHVGQRTIWAARRADRPGVDCQGVDRSGGGSAGGRLSGGRLSGGRSAEGGSAGGRLSGGRSAEGGSAGGRSAGGRSVRDHAAASSPRRRPAGRISGMRPPDWASEHGALDERGTTGRARAAGEDLRQRLDRLPAEPSVVT